MDQQTLFENSKVFHDNNYRVFGKHKEVTAWDGIENVKSLQQQCLTETQREEQIRQADMPDQPAVVLTHSKIAAKVSGKRLAMVNSYGNIQGKTCSGCGAVAELHPKKDGTGLMFCIECLNQEYRQKNKMFEMSKMFQGMLASG